jgi:hypothetical protein
MARGVELRGFVMPVLALVCGESIMARIVEEYCVSLHTIAFSSKAMAHRISVLR